MSTTQNSNASVLFSDAGREIFAFPAGMGFEQVVASLEELVAGVLEFDKNPGVRVVSIVLEYHA